MELTRNKRGAILRRAAEIYRSGEAVWIKGHWIVLAGPLSQAGRSRINSAAPIGNVREFLRGATEGGAP